MQTTVEFRAWFCVRQQSLLPQQMRHRNSAEPAAKAPQEFPAIKHARVTRTEVDRRLARGANVSGRLIHLINEHEFREIENNTANTRHAELLHHGDQLGKLIRGRSAIEREPVYLSDLRR